MIDFIREFKFGRPQQIAALLLLAFIGLLTCYHMLQVPAYLGIDVGPYGLDPGQVLAQLWDGLTLLRCPDKVKLFLPALGFGVSLAGALWWVTRRLYNDLGGYVALVLFCFSLIVLRATAGFLTDIVAGWGLYGLIYTAIGAAHTLYAPPRKWRPRVLLLGVALGVTAGAYLVAALVGLVLAASFMLYLVPGRRKESLGILAIACAIAFLLLLAFYGFDLRALMAALSTKESWAMGLNWPKLPVPNSVLLVQWLLLWILTLLALLTFVVWKRTRYFGNTAPLIVMTVLFLIDRRWAETILWALPFVFTFIGGIFADLLETRHGKVVAWSLGGALVGYAALATAAVLTIPK